MKEYRQECLERYREELGTLSREQGYNDGQVFIHGGSKLYHTLSCAAYEHGELIDDLVERVGFTRVPSVADYHLKRMIDEAADSGGAVDLSYGTQLYEHVKWIANRDGASVDDVLARYGVTRRSPGAKERLLIDSVRSMADGSGAVYVEPNSRAYRALVYYAGKADLSLDQYIESIGLSRKKVRTPAA